jgi:hypothetical protein
LDFFLKIGFGFGGNFGFRDFSGRNFSGRNFAVGVEFGFEFFF